MDGVHTQQVHDKRLDVQTLAWNKRLLWSTANLLDVTSSTPQTESRVFKSQTILLTVDLKSNMIDSPTGRTHYTEHLQNNLEMEWQSTHLLEV